MTVFIIEAAFHHYSIFITTGGGKQQLEVSQVLWKSAPYHPRPFNLTKIAKPKRQYSNNVKLTEVNGCIKYLVTKISSVKISINQVIKSNQRESVACRTANNKLMWI